MEVYATKKEDEVRDIDIVKISKSPTGHPTSRQKPPGVTSTPIILIVSVDIAEVVGICSPIFPSKRPCAISNSMGRERD